MPPTWQSIKAFKYSACLKVPGHTQAGKVLGIIIHITAGAVPGVLVSGHGPFAWGKSGQDAVHNAVVMEEVSMMAFNTLQLNPTCQSIDQVLLDKHYLRKHGSNAYYGQKT